MYKENSLLSGYFILLSQRAKRRSQYYCANCLWFDPPIVLKPFSITFLIWILTCWRNIFYSLKNSILVIIYFITVTVMPSTYISYTLWSVNSIEHNINTLKHSMIFSTRFLVESRKKSNWSDLIEVSHKTGWYTQE